MKLFESMQLGRLTLPNHVVMAPMTRSRAVGGIPNALMRDYYTQRATAGLLITEGTAPSPNAMGYARMPGLYSAEQVAGWRLVTDSVHAAGGRIVAQLMHTGRMGHPLNLPAGARMVAPSAVAAAGDMFTDQHGPLPLPEPEAMSASDLVEARAAFVSAAKNAIDAGFDAIELHGANGYLLEQFLHPHSNRRTDAYGGSVLARMRFVAEVIDASAAAIGADRVGLRLSPYGTLGDLPEHAEADVQMRAVAAAARGLLYLHLVTKPSAAYAATEAALGTAFAGPLMLNGGFERESAEAALVSGRARLVSFGRPFLANPDLVQRLEADAPLAAPDFSTLYTAGPKGYVDHAQP